MTPLCFSHFRSTLPSEDRAQLLLQQNYFTLVPLSLSNSFSFTVGLSPLSPKPIYPFPYHLQPRGQVVPYLHDEGWVSLSLSTGDPSLGSGFCPSLHLPSTQEQRISLPSQSTLHSVCQVCLDEWRSIMVHCYPKPSQ